MLYDTSELGSLRDHSNRNPGNAYVSPTGERGDRERLGYRLDMPPVVSELSPYFEGTYRGIRYS